MSLSALSVLAVLVVLVLLPVRSRAQHLGVLVDVPRLVLAFLVLLTFSGLLVTAILACAETLDGIEPGPGLIASVRTAVLSVSAVVLTDFGRRGWLPRAQWLVVPLLALTCFKVLIEEARIGSAAALFVSLAIYGGSLILSSWIQRKRSPGDEAPPR
jgi:hypothetical protein